MPAPASPTPHLRPLGEGGDRERLRALCPRLSPRSRHLRFQGAVNELSGSLLEQLLDLDHRQREALIAMADDQILGVARYAADDDPSRAEVAVVVADEWQRRGIAAQLVTRLAGTAVEHGIRTFTASVLRDNDEARRLIGAVAPRHHLANAADGLRFSWDIASGLQREQRGPERASDVVPLSDVPYRSRCS
ncbi:GNAT family N-acetyltransferase [Streptomyces parvulus]|uniref:GNAT family N-acetyltransferase n=1 Tax=Streptomyces parvulus TaxID=146923 RepID=UPI00340D1C3C